MCVSKGVCSWAGGSPTSTIHVTFRWICDGDDILIVVNGFESKTKTSSLTLITEPTTTTAQTRRNSIYSFNFARIQDMCTYVLEFSRIDTALSEYTQNNFRSLKK